MRCLIALFASVLLANLIVQCAAQDCGAIGNDCDMCTGDPACGYCTPTETCQAGSEFGPSPGVCNDGWIFGAGSCPVCSNFQSCLECTEWSACGWCPTTGTCVVLDANNTAQCHHECPCGTYTQCLDCVHAGCKYCAEEARCMDVTATNCPGQLTQNCSCEGKGFQSCEACNFQQTCAWCGDNKGCVKYNPGSTTCMTSHFCPKPKAKRGFDGGSFVGGMFLGLGIFVVGVLSYYGWQWYRRGSGYENMS